MVSFTDVIFSDSRLYSTEGLEAKFYTITVAGDVQFPVELLVSLPKGTAQGQIALASASGGAPGGDQFGQEITVVLNSASEAQGAFCLVPPVCLLASGKAKSSRGRI